MSDPLSMSASYVETLTEHQAAEVMSAWVQAKRIELPESLAHSKSKVHARLAKKALYQLRSGGVARAEVAPVVTLPKAPMPALNDLPAVMTSVIGNGERGLLFGRPIRGGGCEIYEAVVQDELGILSMQYGEAQRGLYRERLKHLRSGPNPVLFVSFDRILEELSHAAAHNALGHAPLNLDTQAVLSKLGVVPNARALPIGDVRDDDPALADHAATLHDEPECASWLPPDTELARLAQKLEESPTATPEQKREIAAALSVAFASKTVRALYAGRLWRTAEFFEGTARLAQGQLARAEARRLLHSEATSTFLARLFTKVPDAAVQAVTDT